MEKDREITELKKINDITRKVEDGTVEILTPGQRQEQNAPGKRKETGFFLDNVSGYFLLL